MFLDRINRIDRMLKRSSGEVEKWRSGGGGKEWWSSGEAE